MVLCMCPANERRCNFISHCLGAYTKWSRELDPEKQSSVKFDSDTSENNLELTVLCALVTGVSMSVKIFALADIQKEKYYQPTVQVTATGSVTHMEFVANNSDDSLTIDFCDYQLFLSAISSLEAPNRTIWFALYSIVVSFHTTCPLWVYAGSMSVACYFFRMLWKKKEAIDWFGFVMNGILYIIFIDAFFVISLRKHSVLYPENCDFIGRDFLFHICDLCLGSFWVWGWPMREGVT